MRALLRGPSLTCQSGYRGGAWRAHVGNLVGQDKEGPFNKTGHRGPPFDLVPTFFSSLQPGPGTIRYPFPARPGRAGPVRPRRPARGGGALPARMAEEERTACWHARRTRPPKIAPVVGGARTHCGDGPAAAA